MSKLIMMLTLLVALLVNSNGQSDENKKMTMSGDPEGKLVLVENGKNPIPIVIPKNPALFVIEAATDLAEYIKKISGAKPKIIQGTPEPPPAHAVYVGYQPILKKLFPKIDFDFKHPEEILFAADGNNLVICGRDRSFPAKSGDERTRKLTAASTGFVPDPENGLIWSEAGTSCAVYEFIENCLRVRWLWEGPIGTDIIKSPIIAFSPFQYRFYPIIRKRHLWPRWMKNWYRRQRIYYYSNHWAPGHSFTQWWEKYHEDHPEIFAWNGLDRTPPLWGLKPNPKAIKLCVSNPDVRALLLDEVEKSLKINPSLEVVRATPNDGWNYCACAACKAMDHPKAEKNGRHTDRYVKFWNALARDLKRRFPDRGLLVGAASYGLYRDPPIEARLDNGIVVAHVGHFPTVGQKHFEKEKKEWLGWADMAEYMMYRPNLFRMSGAFGERRPAVELDRTIEAFEFLVNNKCVGIDVDTLSNSWALQGPQYYLMAQLMYHPEKDGQAVLKDYFQRGFGPAAEEVENYFRLMEKTNYAVLETLEGGVKKDDKDMATKTSQLSQTEIRDKIWSDDKLVAKATELMKQAEKKLVDAPEIYKKRLEFIKVGFDYFRLTAEITKIMKRLRKNDFNDSKLAREALGLYNQREKLFKSTWKSKGHYLRYSLSSIGDLNPPDILLAPGYGRMKNLSEAKKNDQLIAEFGETDFTVWPETIAPKAFLLRAGARSAVGDKLKAVDDYSQCVKRMNADEKMWGAALRSLGGLYEKDGKSKEAVELYRRELPRFGKSRQAGSFDHGMVVLQAGKLLEKQGKLDEALDVLTSFKIISATPKYNILEAIGDILAKKGERDGAREKYLEALRMYKKKTCTSGFYERRRSRVRKKLEGLGEVKTGERQELDDNLNP